MYVQMFSDFFIGKTKEDLYAIVKEKYVVEALITFNIES